MRTLVEFDPRASNWSSGSNLEMKQKLIRRNVALWFIVALILIRSSPTVASARFNVLTFGAVGDGKADDTKAFLNAWTAACAVESAVLLAPAGHSFKIARTTFRGPCRPQLVFQVDGILVPQSGPEAWPKDHLTDWLVFRDLVQVTLMGSGTFDGNGHRWWDIPCKNKGFRGPCESPAMIRFLSSKNVVVKRLRLQNSPKFHLTFFHCRGVHIEHLTIFSPKLSPNTDGIHLQRTESVGIYDSNISAGDDCISIGPGCAHVDIRGVTCGPSHGISIGSLGEDNSQACVSNITVRHSIIKDSSNGLRIKTWQGGKGRVWSILYQNIEMQNVKNCLLVDQYYCSSKNCQNQTSAVYVSDVKYRKITGTYDVKKPPILFACSDTVACINITLSEVELHPHIHEKVEDPFCWNAYGTELTPTLPPIRCLKDGNPHVSANIVSQCDRWI